MTVNFVPADFEVPQAFEGPGFRLEPLGAEHNERDHEAWMSSMDHINATPGLDEWKTWPRPKTLEENLADLVRHSDGFEQREEFAYSVLDSDDVIGCLYIYPTKEAGHDAQVVSWVSEARAEMDVVVWRSITEWLAASWPFTNPRYAARVEG